MAISKALRFQILRRDNHTCQSCGRTAPAVVLQIDHVIPEALGGQTVPENLRTLCADCNGGKSATPPDAAQVAAVSADAIRWAEAMKTAAGAMLGTIRARNAVYRQFDEAWDEWPDTPRPATWKNSIDSFAAAGLPVEILLDCLDRAMSNPKIRPWDTFRYMCGIAWSRVTELQKAAQAAAAQAGRQPHPTELLTPAERDWIAVPAHAEGRHELAEEILEVLDDDTIQEFLERAARTAREDDEEDVPADDQLRSDIDFVSRAASLAATDHIEILGGVEMAIDHLLKSLPPDAAARCLARAEDDVRSHMGPEYTRWDVLRWLVFCVGYEISENGVRWDDAPVGAEAVV